jgi:hypothetical protein
LEEASFWDRIFLKTRVFLTEKALESPFKCRLPDMNPPYAKAIQAVSMKLLPNGLDDFETIRQEGQICADKTKFFPGLANPISCPAPAVSGNPFC